MKINKEIFFKSNVILLSIIVIDIFCIVGASPIIGSTIGLSWAIHDSLNTWTISIMAINMFFIIPLSLWIKEGQYR